jgi:hypothetical protein
MSQCTIIQLLLTGCLRGAVIRKYFKLCKSMETLFNNRPRTACCPKIPAAKKRLKSRGVIEISATSPPSSISQLGNVGNSRASKLLTTFAAIKFQSVVTMSETQKEHAIVKDLLVVHTAELQSGVWIHTCFRRTCPPATTRACDRGCHATLPLTGLHKR